MLLLCLAVPASAQFVAQDPTRYIPNARVLGMGKAYMGLANDAGSIYTNPAGLAEVSGWQFSSMSGKFLDEYTYLSFSGLYPTPYGTLGIGYAGTSIGGAFATTIEADSDPDDPIYAIDPSQPQMGNNNSAIVLSYGNQAGGIPYINKIPFADKLAIGANFKIFKASLSGDSIVNGDASGNELDLGLKFYPPWKWLKLGLTGQNILPASLGGKLVYTSGHEEAYPAVIETGVALALLGKGNALRTLGDHELRLALDVDYRPTLTGYPMIGHLGAEWKPIPLIALRAGLDQDAAGDGAGNMGVVSDPTYGVGLYFSGFAFDYAYHTFGGAPNVDNHFFSLSYSFQSPPMIKEPLLISSPPDKLITFESNVPVAGVAADPKIKTLTVKGVPLKVDLQGNFSTTAELKIGKNAVVIEGRDEKNAILASVKRRILRLMTFPDVPLVYWVREPISLLAMTNIITGYPDGTFRPEGNITRAEMCTLLMKAKSEILSTKSEAISKFQDVNSKHWAAAYIAQASDLGVVKGYPGNVFKPNGKITRAEGLAMVARFAGISEEVYSRQFPDIGASHWAAAIITGATKAGLLEYLKNKDFEPNRQLTRAETVEMLQRTEFIQTLLKKDLLNWDSY